MSAARIGRRRGPKALALAGSVVSVFASVTGSLLSDAGLAEGFAVDGSNQREATIDCWVVVSGVLATASVSLTAVSAGIADAALRSAVRGGSARLVRRERPLSNAASGLSAFGAIGFADDGEFG